METRGVSINAFAEPPNKGKTMFPWRDSAKGHIAKTFLPKDILFARLHLMDGTTGVGKKWDDLVPVFKKEYQISEYMIDLVLSRQSCVSFAKTQVSGNISPFNFHFLTRTKT